MYFFSFFFSPSEILPNISSSAVRNDLHVFRCATVGQSATINTTCYHISYQKDRLQFADVAFNLFLQDL